LIAAEDCPPERVGLIYNGVDFSYFEGEASSLSRVRRVQGSGLVLVTVANLIPYKGHSDLLHALSAVATELPQDWQLLCIGRDQGLGRQLGQLARELDLVDHVHFLGERRDLASLLESADIGLLCSHQEGFANAVLEGMAAGLPMIVTDVGGNSEAVVHGQTGLVVPAHDPSAIGRAILELAGDARKRIAMGKAGLERVKSNYTIDRCVADYDRLYHALQLGRRPAQIEGIAAPI
jgi:glycosyltransferase involved in cell wall biosynthesis